ncbi:MAG TPA: hypothetical protein VFY81_02285 [Gammaproteobacteria bacterium]|nr:hypothetical protein [Gammaproteobacteria bacterium]
MIRCKRDVRAVVLLAALLGLLAGCAGYSPFVNPWQDMRLHINTTYYQARDELKISGEFITKPPKGFGRDPKKIRGYEDFQISFNGQPFARQDYNAVLPIGPRLRHVGYEFAGVLPAPGSVVTVVLVARGQTFAFNIPIERIEIAGLPARFDRNDNLVLTYQGPTFGEGSTGYMSAYIGPTQSQYNKPLEVSILERIRPKRGGGVAISPKILEPLIAGRVEFFFLARSQKIFHLNDLETKIYSTIHVPKLYADAY